MSYVTPALKDTQIVKSLADLPAPVSQVITLEAKVYQINGAVDIDDNRIVLVAGSLILGIDFNIDSITSSTTGALFTATNITVTMKNLTLAAANSSKLIDFSGTGAQVLVLQEIISFVSPVIATINNAGNTVIQDCAFISATTGITFSGTLNDNLNINLTGFLSYTGKAIDLGSSEFNTITFDALTFSGTGGSNTDLDGLASSGNIKTGGAAVVIECTFSLTGTKLSNIESSDVLWNFKENRRVKNSTVSAEIQVFGNSTTTTIPAGSVGARVLMNVTGATGTELNRITVATDAVSTYIGIEDSEILFDGNVLLEPASSTKDLACQFVSICLPQTVVTFTNATNLINDTATPLVDGDQITFKDNAGTLPTGLFDNIIYFVVSKLTNSFQVSYTSGGSAITFTTDGSGTNSYKIADLHGSIPHLPIAANSPRTLIPQALHTLITDDEISIVVINQDDAVDIDITDAYYRVTL